MSNEINRCAMEYLCKYIETNNLQNIIIELIKNNELALHIIMALSSLSLTWLAYKLKQRLDSNQGNHIDTAMSIFGWEPSITVPFISFVLTVILCCTQLPGLIDKCHFIDSELKLKNFFDAIIIYPSLSICLLLVVNALVSFLFAVIPLFRKDKSSGFVIVNLVVAAIQLLAFFYSIPDYS